MAQLVRLNPPTLPGTEMLGYSQISIAAAGRLAFVSGQVAVPVDGAAVPAGIGEQTDLTIRNLSEALHALGASPAEIVQLRIYVVDISQISVTEIMGRIRNFLRGTKPSLTGIGVTALASPDLLLEIEMVVQLSAD